jgi:predicted nucleic acid-binding protein
VAGLIDTSVLVAREQGRPLPELPDPSTISVMTLAELHLGVLAARGPRERARRTATLGWVEHAYDAIPVDGPVARRYSELVDAGRRNGHRFSVVDLLIGATALAHGLPLYTQDADFERMPGLTVVRV